MVKVLTIGDLHFKTSNGPLCDLVVQKITAHVVKHRPDMVVFLGDNNDTHEKINMFVLNRLVRFFKNIATMATVILIIGNHDRPDSTTYLTEESAFYCLKGYQNIYVADSVMDYSHNVPGSNKPIRFLFVPYVPPGTFMASLSNLKTPVDHPSAPVTAVFCHQTFVGANIGRGNTSKRGDVWPTSYPTLISGHLHIRQRPQPNVMYPGTPYQQSYDDESEKVLYFCDFSNTESPKIGTLKLDIMKKRSIKLKTSQVETFVPPADCQVKIEIEGPRNEIEDLTKRGVINKMRSKGVSVSLTPERNPNNRNPDNKSYQELLLTMIEDDPDAKLVYDSIFRTDATEFVTIQPTQKLDTLLNTASQVFKFPETSSFQHTERGGINTVPSFNIDSMGKPAEHPSSPAEIQNMMTKSIIEDQNKPLPITTLDLMNASFK
jgi:DNA repair exonuclease SbcCD nuclease subunit